MKVKLILLWSLLAMTLGSVAFAQDSARVRVQLIAADQASSPSDQALAPIMSKLRRMPYKRFQQKGSRVVNLQPGKEVKTGLSGHTMRMKLESIQKGRATMNLNWAKGRSSVVNLTAVMKHGAPFVCGGPREGGVTWIAVFSLQ